MRLLWARAQNFKLLEDVEIDFSADPDRPLTVIRAENGSGKTSLMFALSWGLFGDRGLPADAQQLRIISSNAPAGEPVTVRVTIEFENWTPELGATRYRLTRTVDQTPQVASDKVTRGVESVSLDRLAPEGNKRVDPEQLFTILPPRLKDVFFTNGDDVQSFVAGTLGQGHQQDHVKEVLRVLLSIDRVEDTVLDLGVVAKKLRNEAAKLGGADLAASESSLRTAEQKRDGIVSQLAELRRIEGAMASEDNRLSKELSAITGVGNVDVLNAQINQFTTDMKRLSEERRRSQSELRNLLSSQDMAWDLGSDVLATGLAKLNDLADRKVIPGISVQVLHDRLKLETCICGESLDDASADGRRRRAQVQQVIADQQIHSEVEHRQTGVWHQARAAFADHTAKIEHGNTVWQERERLIRRLNEIREDLEGKADAKKNAEEARARIDDSRIRELSGRLAGIQKKLKENLRAQGALESDLKRADSNVAGARERYEKDSESQGKSSGASRRAEIAADLEQLASGILSRLKREYVDRIAERTSSMFLEIVGSSPEFESAVFTGVTIDPVALQITVQTQHGRSLDPAFEVNGASQRALTLAFIWAVTEVSGTIAPRIIDSPLGMVAGGVKTRMVEAITAPAQVDAPDYQVVLLLTRSEIRDIEGLLDERAGEFNTLSCSKDYPTDLRFDWGKAYPVVRACKCDHRHSCDVCARTSDAISNVTYVPGTRGDRE